MTYTVSSGVLNSTPTNQPSLERGADLHTAQLMPLPLTVSCCSKIQIGFTCLVPAHLGSPGQRAIKLMYVIISGEHQKLMQKAVRWPCGVSRIGVCSNSLQCTSCQKWVHN